MGMDTKLVAYVPGLKSVVTRWKGLRGGFLPAEVESPDQRQP